MLVLLFLSLRIIMRLVSSAPDLDLAIDLGNAFALALANFTAIQI